MNSFESQQGFIALISVLIISSVLLVSVVSLAQFGVANRYFLLDLENKTKSQKLAESCVHVARLKVFQDPATELLISEPDIIIPVGSEECSITLIDPDTTSTPYSVIETFAKVDGGATTNLRVFVKKSNGDFTYWAELPII